MAHQIPRSEKIASVKRAQKAVERLGRDKVLTPLQLRNAFHRGYKPDEVHAGRKGPAVKFKKRSRSR